MSTAVPLTVGDLREIAKRLAQWEKRLTEKGGGWSDASALVERIEIHRPDEPGDIIGHFVLIDEWVGFLPKGWEA
jgi:hypothetical protein